MADTTERLLDVIARQYASILTMLDYGEFHEGATRESLSRLMEALTELRRRGDTLVRAADLLIALEVRPGEIGTTSTADTLHRAEAMRRLEKSLHGDTFPTGRENT